MLDIDTEALYADLAKACERPGCAAGYVMCKKCGRIQRQDFAEGLKHGWPKCCGYTMTLDVPAELVSVTEPRP